MWVEDPDGAPWEVYAVLADAPVESGVAGDGTCCAPDRRDGGAGRRRRRPVLLSGRSRSVRTPGDPHERTWPCGAG